MTLKTLNDITFNSKEESADLTNIRIQTEQEIKDNLRENIKEWVAEVDEIIDLYIENRCDDGFQTGLTDDEVMNVMKRSFSELDENKGGFIDYTDDDLSRFYFLFEFLKYFLNLEAEK